MNWSDWYTDQMDVYRVTEIKSGNLTRHERGLVLAGVPCRIYQSDNRAINMAQTAAVTNIDHIFFTQFAEGHRYFSHIHPGGREGRFSSILCRNPPGISAKRI